MDNNWECIKYILNKDSSGKKCYAISQNLIVWKVKKISQQNQGGGVVIKKGVR